MQKMDYTKCSFTQICKLHESGQISFDLLKENISRILDTSKSNKEINRVLGFLKNSKNDYPQLINSVQADLEKVPISFYYTRHPEGFYYRFSHARFVLPMLRHCISNFDTEELISKFQQTTSVNLQVTIFQELCRKSKEPFPSEMMFILDYQGFYEPQLAYRILYKFIRIFNVFGYYTHTQPNDSDKYIEILTPFVLKQLEHPDKDIRTQAMCILGFSKKKELLPKIVPFLHSKEYVADCDCDDYVECPVNGRTYDKSNGRPISDLAVISMKALDFEKSVPYFLEFLKEPNLTEIYWYNPRIRIMGLFMRNVSLIPEEIIKPICYDDQSRVAVDAFILLNEISLAKNSVPLSLEAWVKKFSDVPKEPEGNSILYYLNHAEWFNETSLLNKIVDEVNVPELKELALEKLSEKSKNET